MSVGARSANQPIPPGDLLDDLERVCRDLGEAATTAQYNENGRYSARSIRRRFDSWANALERLGYEPQPPVTHSKYNLEALDPEDLGLSPIGQRA